MAGYFYPEKAASSYLSENRNSAFVKAGFEVLIYTPIPTRGITEEERKKFSKKKHRTEKMYGGGLTVHRFRMFNEGKNSMIRALRYLFCWLYQFHMALFSKNVDVIFLTSTPPIQGLIGSWVGRIRNIPFVYNLQDIFPDSLVGTSLATKGGLLWKIGRWIENTTYKGADKIIVISEDFKKNIIEKGVPEEKIEVIYNWVDENAVVDVPRENNKLFDKYCLDRSKFYITYSGNIGLTQNMDMLLDVMEDFKTEAPDVRLVLIGEGAYKEQVEKMVAEKMLDSIALLPFQPYEDISHVFSLGDVGLVISKPGVGANSVPSKTWSIMSASRPVLANFDENELKDIITNNKCGLFTKAGDKESFKNAVLQLYNDRTICREYGLNGRRFVMENLTRETGTKKYVDVIKSFEKK